MSTFLSEIHHFVQPEIPQLHPLSLAYKSYWHNETKNIIEGKWINGVWCPPQLYHYLNFAIITIGEKKDRYKSRPFNLDYIWDLAYCWIEARGLSGFEKVGDVPNIREFLRQKHSEDLGRPIYNNPAKNLLCLAGRGFGKSYWAANLAAHEFVTDGRREYNPGEKVTNVAEILLSAYSSTYVNDLIAKIDDILNNYPGGMEINGIYYPPPFFKNTLGTWTIGKKKEAKYKKKVGGTWKKFGTGSCFKPRVYKDNHTAAAGGRNTLKIGEEIGMWDNIIDSHFMDENTQKLNNYKFGSTLYIGTGGDNTGEGTLAIQKMMYDPETFDCLVFEDTYENRGKIGLFYPITFTKLNYKKAGITDWELAIQTEATEREKKKASKNNEAYDNYVIFNPLVPSEIFLSKTNNKFPLKDLQATLASLEVDNKSKNAEYIGDLIINPDGEIEWQSNPKNRPIYDFPLRGNTDKKGDVVIYQMPYKDENSNIPWGRYIAGIDPYDHDDSQTESLGSTVVMDRLTNRIVAEYTGRPVTAKEYYENARRLIVFFNAQALYENEKKGIFDYFEAMNCLHHLADQPKIIKDVIQNSTVRRGKGMHMIIELKLYGEGLINQWLRDTNDGEQKNVHKLRCIPLLKELILYNTDGNFDRVMALMMCIYQLNEMRRMVIHEEEKVKTILESDFFKKGIVKNNVYNAIKN